MQLQAIKVPKPTWFYSQVAFYARCLSLRMLFRSRLSALAEDWTLGSPASQLLGFPRF